MRSIFLAITKIYLWPFTFHKGVRRFVKHNFFLDTAEHLTQLCKIIRQEKNYNDGEVIIDVGAADGSVSSFLAKQFPKNIIFSFEANPTFYKKLKLISKKFPNILVKESTLWSSKTTLQFYVTDNLLSSSLKKINCNSDSPSPDHLKLKETIQVETRCLNEEFNDEKEEILLIKLDVQGAELEILTGADNLLSRTKYILVEQQTHTYYEKAAPYYKIDEFLRNHNFEIADIVVTYRRGGLYLEEFDAIYRNKNFNKTS